MNTQQMKVFLEVAEQGSFTAAAEKLYISQPAVSKQVRLLENELGTELLRRDRSRGVVLTEFGELYCDLFRRFLSALAETEALVAARKAQEKKRLRIGIVEGWELPGELRGVIDSLGVAVSWQTYPFRELARHLTEGKLDLAFALSLHAPKLKSGELTQLDGIFLFSDNHRRRGESYCLEDLRGDEIVLLELPEGEPVDNTRLYDSLGFDPKVRFLPNRDSVLFALRGGDCFAFFDSWTRYRQYPGYAWLPSGTKSMVRLYWRGDDAESAVFADQILRLYHEK